MHPLVLLGDAQFLDFTCPRLGVHRFVGNSLCIIEPHLIVTYFGRKGYGPRDDWRQADKARFTAGRALLALLVRPAWCPSLLG